VGLGAGDREVLADQHGEALVVRGHDVRLIEAPDGAVRRRKSVADLP
jgi:hypothetical protein